MARRQGCDAIYDLADLFRRRCLIDGKSLLWPGENAWNEENIQLLWNAFAKDFPDKKSSFIENFGRQISELPRDAQLIAVDILCFYYLFPSGMAPSTKNSRVEKLREHITLWPDTVTREQLESAYKNTDPDAGNEKSGIGGTGPDYTAKIPYQIAFFLDFPRAVYKEGTDLLSRESVQTVADRSLARIRGDTDFGRTPSTARNVLLHLLFPDHYDRAVGPKDREKIVRFYGELVPPGLTRDIDSALLQIRNAIASTRGIESVDFYEDELPLEWNPKSNGTQLNEVQSEADFKVDIPQTSVKGSCDLIRLLTYASEEFVNGTESLLKDKRQIIYEGPPGSGKTFVAEKFARWFAGGLAR